MNDFQRTCIRFPLALFFVLLVARTASGQWVTESFSLSNGWNAIYLRGSPWPAALDSQFAGLPIRAVHRNYLTYDTAQFTESSGDLPTRGTEWLIWYPTNSPHRLLTTLWSLSGNGAYLIECYTNCTWTPKGVPVIPARLWLPNTWNFVGLPVNPGREVTFTEFFRNAHNVDVSPSPAGGKVFRVLPSGQQQDISSQTAILAMNPKESYWILTQGLSAYIGTIFAHATMGTLKFPPSTSISSFTLRNELGSNQTVSVTLVASEAPPAGAPTRMGDVPLLHFDYDNGSYQWEPLPMGVPLTKSLASNEEWTVTLAVNRSLMSTPSSTDATWQSVLEVTDEGGTLVRVPVVAEYGADSSYDALWPNGLWVGDVTLNKVTQLANGNVSGLQPTSGDLTFRLILHIGTNGQSRLLQQTVMQWSQRVTGNITNSFYRLLTSTHGLTGSNQCSRVSSVGFPYGLNALMSGDPVVELTGSYVVGYDSPSNPFKHIYNPNHDNLSYSGELLAEGQESYTLSNSVRLVMDSVQALSSSAALWNPEEGLTGRYFQTVQGLRNEAIQAEGSFILRRVSRTGVLE